MVFRSDDLLEPTDTSGLIIPPPLLNVLRPHQIAALHFLWRRLVEEGMEQVVEMIAVAPLTDVARLSRRIFGCIIGHSMGLGKTITALCFVLLLQRHYQSRAGVSDNSTVAVSASSGGAGGLFFLPALRVIVLTPRSCTFQWQSSIAEWMLPELFADTHMRVYAPLCSSNTLELLSSFYQTGGILLLGYEEYQSLLRQARRKVDSMQQCGARVGSIFDSLRRSLPSSGRLSLLEILESADVVILDESHRLKRPNSKLVVDLIEHMRNVQLRVALTGTPLQNHLEEYNIMYSVVTGYMVNSASFRRLFTLPIERGQCVDSTFQQFTEMKKCVASLRRFFGETVHHCGPEVLERELPARKEYIILVGLSPSQEEAYRDMLKKYKNNDKFHIIIALHHEASHICFHPWLTRQKAREVAHFTGFLPASTLLLSNIIKEHETDNNNAAEDGAGGNNDNALLGDHGSSLPVFSFLSSPSSSCSSLDNMPFIDLNNTVLERLDITESPKLALTISLLRHISDDLKEKTVLFSTYISHLFLLKELLQHRGIAADVLHGKLDAKERQHIVERFTNDSSRMVLLCSTKVGGVGINLSAANHCVLFDVSWNPADDMQATYRVYRYGQRKPVTIYRIATEGTFEHVVFFYALRKLWLQKKILNLTDSTRYERHNTENYFVYPCGLPFDFEMSDSEQKQRDPLPNSNAVQQRWREYAARSCPAVALTAADGTFAWVRSITEHSFFFKNNVEEIISEIGKRFEVVERWQVPQLPVTVQSDIAETRFLNDTEFSSVLDGSDPALCEYIRTCAQHLVSKAQRLLGVMRKDRVTDQASTSSTLCRLFEAVAHLKKPVGKLEEIIAMLFYRGVDEVMRRTLNRPSYAKLRAFFCSKGGMGSHDTLESLLYSLRHRPCAIFSLIHPAEATYILTEMGLLRPFVPHCVICGVYLTLRESKASIETIARLHSFFSLCNLSFCQPKGEHDKDSNKLDVVVMVKKRTVTALVSCIEELWPLYEGMALLKVSADLDNKKRLMGIVYERALGRASGLLSAKKTARLLGLCPVRGRNDLFHCKRCADGLLRCGPQDDATLRCSCCHYSAEFYFQTDASTHHACILYQFFLLCALLATFSVLRSFAAPFTPSSYPGVLQLLFHLQRLVSACEAELFIRNALLIGLDVLLSGLPETAVAMLRLQCGEANVAALKDRMAADSSHVWSVVLGTHVRQMVVDWLKTATAGKRLHTTAMPEVILLLALQAVAKTASCYGGYAKDVLLTSIQTREVLMMRFVCDALVKLIYVERLLDTTSKPLLLDAFVKEYTATDIYLHNSSSSNKKNSNYNCGANENSNDDSISSASFDTSSLSTYASVLSATNCVHARKRRRQSSLLSCSNSFGGSSISSSFDSCYFDDDDDKDMVSGEETAADSSHQKLMGLEGIVHQRCAQYWAAYCEVYGTRSIELLTVMLEDEENGMTILPPPSSSFWVTEAKTATLEGMTLEDVAEEFFARLMSLTANVRIIS